MKREEMDKIIRFELGYVPMGSKGSTQNKLRFYYNAYRRRGLAEGRSREESLKDAIDKVREGDPGFDPRFDRDFFRIPKKGLFRRLLERIGKM